jgi:hypothetical protein
LKVSAYLRDPKAVLFHLPSFLLEALGTANPSRAPKYVLVFSEVRVAQSLVFGVVIGWWLLVLVITDIGVNQHERLFNITQRFYCCSTSHIHGRVFNNENNSYPKTSVKMAPSLSVSGTRTDSETSSFQG